VSVLPDLADPLL